MAKDTIYKITIEGIRPLLMHNGQLADPMNEYTKALKVATSPKQKSDEQHIEVMRTEFQGSLYHDEKLGPYIPADNLAAMLERASGQQKLRPKFKAGVGVLEPDDAPGYALEYKGPRDRVGLWNAPAFVFRKGVKVTGKKIIRTRPRFATGWRVSFEVEVLGGMVTAAQLEKSAVDGGLLFGLGDWIPRYGRFVVKTFK